MPSLVAINNLGKHILSKNHTEPVKALLLQGTMGWDSIRKKAGWLITIQEEIILP